MHKDGHIITVLNNSRPLTNSKDEVVGMQSTLIDITERKQAEQQLGNRENFYRSLIETPGTGYVVVDIEGKVVEANKEYVRLTGHKTLEDILNRSVTEWTAEYDLQRNAQEVQKCAELGFVHDLQIDYVGKNGMVTPIEINAKLVDVQNETYILALCRDVTERKKSEAEQARLQRELQQAHKMESLGHLTGGIAHDFNNLLSIISGFTELSLETKATKDDLKLNGYLNHLKNATQRATSLVSQMLSFSRINQSESLPMDIVSVLKEEVNMLRATLPSTIDLDINIDDKLPAILMNPTQLQQMVMNLCINARDAMDGEGKLGIRLGWARDLDTESPVSHKPISGDWIELSITDTGSGIAADIIEEIFTPFFTTKEVGKGTGMGLSVVYGIMENHGGHILIESEPGKGACLCLLFPPITEEASLTVDTDSNVTELPVGHGENILVVDDEESITTLIKEMLGNFDYRPTITTDSIEALSLFKENPDKFAMLITDQTMPKLTGLQLITQLRKIQPNLPVILCSGFSDKINEEEAEIKNIHYFNKPVSLKKLSKKIAQLLNTN